MLGLDRRVRKPSFLAFCGALLAAVAVALAAYAAHGVDDPLAQSRLQTAALHAFGHGAVLAVPVRVGAEPPSLALSLSGPESRVNPRRTTGLSIREREHLALLKDAAGRLARHSR